jgi:hypothetical protein
MDSPGIQDHDRIVTRYVNGEMLLGQTYKLLPPEATLGRTPPIKRPTIRHLWPLLKRIHGQTRSWSTHKPRRRRHHEPWRWWRHIARPGTKHTIR